jgi:DHA3 family tetracycline resistance protein-like MFS transporter
LRLFSALSHRPFALLWVGRSVSSLGDGIYLVALAWWVLATTGSAAANGVILICATAPMLLLLLVGGVVVDRVSRRRLLVEADIIRGLVVIAVAVLAWWHLLAFWQLALLSALFGAVRAFFYPAYTSIIPEITPREALPSANALATLSVEATGILGPALGGVLVALGGTPAAFALDGLSFFLSAGCILLMPLASRRGEAASLPASAQRGERSEHSPLRCGEEAEERKVEAAGELGSIGATVSGERAAEGLAEVEMTREGAAVAHGASALDDLREGLRTVLGMPWLWITIGIAGVSNITLSGPLEAALPLLVHQSLGGGVGIYATLNTLSAIGAVMAAVALGHAAKLHRRGILLYGAWIVAGVALLVMGLPVGVIGVGLAMLGCSAGITTLGLVWANTLQELVPSERLGRVSSVDALGSYGLLPVGYGLAGVAADRLGAPAVFVIGGAVSAIVVALPLLHPAVRGLD